jgi:hypothetical protein
MLKILNAHQGMLNIIALRLRSNDTKSSFIDKLIIAILSGFLLGLIIPSAIYFIKNISVFVKFVEAFYIFCIFTMFLTVYWNFVMGKTTIRDLLDAVQRIVQISMIFL